ncbi:MAG TPA: glycosyltransferase [Dongiaceae bacterium]|jgi:predicted glycosyltransferase|nr:glycosyltransferase [Dongiaceae bacterium]
MTSSRKDRRILIYSHDSFGLGHLRRCRTIAHALVERDKHLSVLIVTGSPIIGSFTFKARVDFVRVPGVIKLRDGSYVSLSLLTDIKETLAIRESIIRHTAQIFSPDLFIVDKEPLGLRGEVRATLELLKEKGTRLVLGLRDVMDDPVHLAPEWQRKKAMPALRDLYDEIWVYGLQQIADPLDGLAVPASVRQKMIYTGYLPRMLPPRTGNSSRTLQKISAPYILVTAGGGGDGDAIIDWVLKAYEQDRTLPYPALLVLGPFMKSEHQAAYLARAARLPNVEALTFDAQLEQLMADAIGIVAMGGYNTFCEILSFDKRALIVPRTRPRLEQLIRAKRAAELGLVTMLRENGRRPASIMAEALHRLPAQNVPSAVVIPGILNGLATIHKRAIHSPALAKIKKTSRSPRLSYEE